VRAPLRVCADVAVAADVPQPCTYRCALVRCALAGALAGVMWAKILQGKGLQVVYREFAWNGLCVMIPVTFISLLVLYAVT
jgi:hypothetical protein